MINFMKKKAPSLLRLTVFIGTAFFFLEILREFYAIAQRTGAWINGFSLKWGLGFTLTFIFLTSLLIILWFLFWKPEALRVFSKGIITLRQKLSFLRWIFAPLLLIFPIYIFQYTFWGLVFREPSFRLFIWIFLNTLLAILLTKDAKKLITWFPLLQSILLTSTSYTLASVFSNVKDYPFNLYWSDGNRLWDYSIMFGRHLYNYPADQSIYTFISPGRQFLWGLPFLLPNTNILFNRFWSALLLSLPYMILGWIVFKTKEKKSKTWFFLGLWAFLFLNQGPIYTPLILSAILVAITWESPLWIAIPLVAFAGYYAQTTRWTWEFAPAIWAGVLSINRIRLKGVRLTLRDWAHAFILVISGVSLWLFPDVRIPSFLILTLLVFLFFPEKRWQLSAIQKKAIYGIFSVLVIVGLIISNGAFKLFSILQGIIVSVLVSTSRQPLLWYRLLPNDTYPEGILGGLLIAILPLSILLIYLLYKKHWQPSLWQKLAMLASLLVFLAIGLVISTKIGGGNNLHNLDMFLITLLFVTAIAWRNGGSQWFDKSSKAPLWLKTTLILLLVLPAYSFVMGLSPNLALSPNELLQVEVLTNYNKLTDAPIKSLPSDEEIQIALDAISTSAEFLDTKGEVLFIDLRQLLTFGYVPKIRLVPEYEKKRLMNEAMSGNTDYFAPYYQDLADHRFSLIITEPLKVALKNEEGSFAEEGDAWTIWVAEPTLCFYKPIETFKSVYVQLLIPRQEPLDCSAYLK